MTTLIRIKTVLLTAALACGVATQARADLIINGGFESGFSGWTRADQLGSEGTFALQTGTVSPVNGTTVPAPPGGIQAAMTDAAGPGSHVLYQNFMALAPFSTATLSFDLFVGNRAGTFFTPNTLDFSTPALNQRARVDILAGGSNPFSMNPADLLMSVYQTNVGDPAVQGYTHYSFDTTTLLNANLNKGLMLRFAETDNVFEFQFGVDNVALGEPAQVVPEPSYGIAICIALLAAAWIRGRHRRGDEVRI